MDTPRKTKINDEHQIKKRLTYSSKVVNVKNTTRKPIKSLSNVELNEDHALDFPPGYKGSDMFMPTGERLYWQAEVLTPPHGPATCQDFHEIRERCLSEGVLFEDPEFPAENSSLNYTDNFFSLGEVEWWRPEELVENPQLCVNKYSRHDVLQGDVGNCGLVAVIAALPTRHDLFYRVVPSGQRFDKDYAGIFHFRFWQYGRWVDVVIDDRLPIHNGNIFSVHAPDSQPNEFWSALLEKAYAKLYGSYQALDGILELEAMEDFTGGLFEGYELSQVDSTFFRHILSAYKNNSLLSAVTAEGLESVAPDCGIFSVHAYSITCVKYLDDTPLLRLRNPWGRTEWTGAWSDKSPEWKRIPQEVKKALGLTIDNDGEFWISFKDFMKYFINITICNLNPGFLLPDENPYSKEWKMSMFEGKWVPGETAGGQFNNLESHWRNPQYLITVTDPDEENGDNCSVVVSLIQKHARVKYICVGFSVFSVEEEEEPSPLDLAFLEENGPVYDTLEYQGCITRLEVEPGSYVIVPCTDEPDVEGEFLLRVLTEKPHHITKLN